MATGTVVTAVAAGVQRAGVDEPWATLRAGLGTGVYVSAGNYLGYAERSATANQWAQLIRLVLPFDTSFIGPGQIIDSATVSLIGFTKMNAGGVNTPSVALYQLPPSPTPQNVQASDYERITAVQLSNALTFDGWGIGTVNTFTLNATGLAQINPFGWTVIAGRFVWDAEGTPPPDWNAFSVGAWTGDPDRRPFISVTYHAAPAGPPTSVMRARAIAVGDRFDATAIVEGDAP